MFQDSLIHFKKWKCYISYLCYGGLSWSYDPCGHFGAIVFQKHHSNDRKRGGFFGAKFLPELLFSRPGAALAAFFVHFKHQVASGSDLLLKCLTNCEHLVSSGGIWVHSAPEMWCWVPDCKTSHTQFCVRWRQGGCPAMQPGCRPPLPWMPGCRQLWRGIQEPTH